MFSIRLNGQLLELATDARISLTLSSPLFDKDGAERVFSLPFRLPRSPHNESLLEHTGRFDAKRKTNIFSPAVLMVGGAEYENGELIATGGDKDSIEVAFRNIPVMLFEELAKFKINEILETINVGQTGAGGYWQYTMDSYPQTYSISFDDAGIATYTPGGGETIDIATLAFASQINNVVPGIVIGASSGTITLSAAKVNEFQIIQTVALTLAAQIGEGDDDYTDMAAFIATIMATPDTRVAFPMMSWEGAYANKAPHYKKVLNNILDGVLYQNPEYTVDEDWKYGLLPLVRWPYVMSKIETEAGITFDGAVWELDDIQALLIVNNYTLDYVQRDRYPVSSTLASDDFVYQNSFLQEIDLNDHVPGMTAADFVRAFVGTLALYLRYGDGYVRFLKKKDLVSALPFDWSDYVTRDEYDHVIAVEKGYTLDYTRRSEDKYSNGTQLDPYEFGDGSQDLRIPAGTLHTDIAVPATIGAVRMPHTIQKAETGYLGGKASQYPLQFLFDRGLQLTSNGAEYPYATNDDKADDGTTSIGDYSLRWSGDKGLYEQWWKGVAGLEQKPELSIRITIPVGQMYELRKWERAKVRFFHPNGSVILAIKSVEFAIDARNDSGWIVGSVKGYVV